MKDIEKLDDPENEIKTGSNSILSVRNIVIACVVVLVVVVVVVAYFMLSGGDSVGKVNRRSILKTNNATGKKTNDVRRVRFSEKIKK